MDGVSKYKSMGSVCKPIGLMYKAVLNQDQTPLGTSICKLFCRDLKFGHNPHYYYKLSLHILKPTASPILNKWNMSMRALIFVVE